MAIQKIECVPLPFRTHLPLSNHAHSHGTKGYGRRTIHFIFIAFFPFLRSFLDGCRFAFAGLHRIGVSWSIRNEIKMKWPLFVVLSPLLRLKKKEGKCEKSVLNVPMGHLDPNSLLWRHQPIAIPMAIPVPVAIALALAFGVLMALGEHTIVPIVGNLCWRLISFFSYFYFFSAVLFCRSVAVIGENADTWWLLLQQPQKWIHRANNANYEFNTNAHNSYSSRCYFDGKSVRSSLVEQIWMSIAFCLNIWRVVYESALFTRKCFGH